MFKITIILEDGRKVVCGGFGTYGEALDFLMFLVDYPHSHSIIDQE